MGLAGDYRDGYLCPTAAHGFAICGPGRILQSKSARMSNISNDPKKTSLFMILPRQLLGLSLLAFGACLAAIPCCAASRTNVLFIAIDDLTTTAVHCYGNSQIQTPNLDRFATTAVRFDRAYCQFPLCGPSRCSLMLGLRPDTTRLYANSMSNPIRKYFPEIVTLAQMFKNDGYFSGRVGKIYHYGVPGQIGTSGIDDPPSWNRVVNPAGRDKDDENEVIKLIPEHKNLGGTLCWMQARGTDEEQTDGKVAAETIKMLEASKDKPFFIGCGFYRPHVPDIAIKKWFDLYPFEEIRLPKEPEHVGNIPPIALTVKPANFGLPSERLREFKRAYFAATSFVDAQLGKVLGACIGSSSITTPWLWFGATTAGAWASTASGKSGCSSKNPRGCADDPRARREGKWQDLLPHRRVARSVSDAGRFMRSDATSQPRRQKPTPASSKSERRMGLARFHSDRAAHQRGQGHHGPFRPYRAFSIHRVGWRQGGQGTLR